MNARTSRAFGLFDRAMTLLVAFGFGAVACAIVLFVARTSCGGLP